MLFTAEDEKYLRMAGEVLVPQINEILDVWYGFVGANPHLLFYFSNKSDGKPVPISATIEPFLHKRNHSAEGPRRSSCKRRSGDTRT